MPISVPSSSVGLPALRVLEARVEDCSKQLGPAVDESYHLDVGPGLLRISAATQVGVIHALETLSQLISFDHDAGQYVSISQL